MSYYLLVEGRRTEMVLYPAWLSLLLPNLTRAKTIPEVSKKDGFYYVFSGLGMPNLLDRALPSSIADVEANPAFSNLIVVVDSEGANTQNIRDEIQLRFEEYRKKPGITLTVVVQDLCIESWLLGNKKMYSQGPQCPILRAYRSFYDCRIQNPENMRSRPHSSPIGSLADFHFDYLRRVLREKNENYSKRNPANATDRHYLEQIIDRYKCGDISSFGSFWNWINELKK